jgi:branched-chain amino acid transport system permease protein
MMIMRTSWLIAILVLLAAVVPVVQFTDYHLFQLTMVIVYAIAILGLALLTGFRSGTARSTRSAPIPRRS